MAEDSSISSMSLAELQQRYDNGERDFRGVNVTPQQEKVTQIEGGANEGQRAEPLVPQIDLSGADLSKANLSSIDLRRARLVRVRLMGARLLDTRFEDADLTGCNLTNALVGHCAFDRAMFDDAIFGGVLPWLDCSFSGVDLRRVASLRDAKFSKCLMAGVLLSHVNAESCMFSECDLTQARLDGAQMNEAILTESDLSAADLTATLMNKADL